MERYLAVGALLIVAVAAVGLDGLGPQAGALLLIGHSSPDRSSLRADLDGRVRVSAEVVEPGGVLGIAALRGHEHEVLPVLHIDERCLPLLTALGTDVVSSRSIGGEPGNLWSTRPPVAR
jgi:hypothetical protein